VQMPQSGENKMILSILRRLERELKGFLSYSKPSDKMSQCLKYGIGASKERRSLWKKDLSKYRI
jgi:hypothetical protein